MLTTAWQGSMVISPCYTCGNIGSERLSNLPRARQLAVRLDPGLYHPRVWALTQYAPAALKHVVVILLL